jgi:OOP family OmpA-OmpF porin
MRMRILSSMALIMLIMAASPAKAGNGIEIRKVRLGVGGGIAAMSARIPGQTKFSASAANFTVNIGYAVTPVWEAGVIFGAGQSKTDSNGVNTVSIKSPVNAQVYLRGRQFDSGKFGVYGLMTLGALRQKLVNKTSGKTFSDTFAALGFGAGVSWKAAPRFIVDAGVYIPGIPVSSRNSGLTTFAPGVMVSLNYALGDDQPEMPVEEVVEAAEPEPAPVDLRRVEPAPQTKSEPAAESAPEVFRVAEPVEREAVAEEPQQEEIVQIIRLEGVNFAFNSHKLNAGSKAILRRIVGELNNYPYSRIEIVAYTDNLGGDLYNLQLSIRRARAVKAYLVELGIDGSRMSSKGYGEYYPVADNATEEGRAQNRRAELHVIE